MENQNDFYTSKHAYRRNYNCVMFKMMSHSQGCLVNTGAIVKLIQRNLLLLFHAPHKWDLPPQPPQLGGLCLQLS